MYSQRMFRSPVLLYGPVFLIWSEIWLHLINGVTIINACQVIIQNVGKFIEKQSLPPLPL